MLWSASKLVLVLAAFNILAASAQSEDASSFDSDIDNDDTFDSSTKSSDAYSTDVEPPPPSALGSIGPLLSLLQPIIGGILGGPGLDGETPGVTYPPLLKPLFSPLPILPGLGILPSTLAAQASDFIASSALSARMRFANAARENAARSQVNYAAILNAINDANNPTDEPVV